MNETGLVYLAQTLQQWRIEDAQLVLFHFDCTPNWIVKEFCFIGLDVGRL